MPNDYCPASSVYDPTFKQDPLPYCGSKEKLALDPNYYPPNYVPEEDAPLLVDNLVAPPDDPIKEVDQTKQEKGKKNGEEETDGKEQDRREDMEHTCRFRLGGRWKRGQLFRLY